jgi:type II secretory ATPase GspE/PulE/Tfp pilus assembly ATPase PilB-like protein
MEVQYEKPKVSEKFDSTQITAAMQMQNHSKQDEEDDFSRFAMKRDDNQSVTIQKIEKQIEEQVQRNSPVKETASRPQKQNMFAKQANDLSKKAVQADASDIFSDLQKQPQKRPNPFA